ncbi:hypothetical protein AB5J52_47300 [Streptomyces sp. R39]|uniref:Transposase n=1 Tax=Streptomyces sp. R39 TaxID=3238631 RepID=A0AB39R3W6_9ACTN
MTVGHGARTGLGPPRPKRITVDGTWERAVITLMAQADADEDLAWAVSVDSTIMRARLQAGGSP